jgi:hypothetical protein
MYEKMIQEYNNNIELSVLQNKITNIENENSFTKKQIKNIQIEIFNQMKILLEQKNDKITKLQNIIDELKNTCNDNKQKIILENIIEQQNTDIYNDNDVNSIFLNFIKVLEKKNSEYYNLQKEFEFYKINNKIDAIQPMNIVKAPPVFKPMHNTALNKMKLNFVNY